MTSNGAQAGPTHEEVERTIRSVPGVAEARIARSESGRGRLQIRLHPGEDAERVSWSVAATLRERFGIVLDPDEIRPREVPAVAVTGPVEDGEATGGTAERSAEDTGSAGPAEEAVLGGFGDEQAPEPAEEAVLGGVGDEQAPEPTSGPADDPVTVTVPSGGAPEATGWGWRPAIRDLSSSNDGVGVTVTARLALDGRDATGEASSAPTVRGMRTAIAEATVRALAGLVPGPLRAQIDRVTIEGSDPAAVSVIVSLLSGRGEELLLGAAIVRDDVEHAVMRATLDALNRRVEPDLVG